jgi:hypothetical protein
MFLFLYILELMSDFLVKCAVDTDMTSPWRNFPSGIMRRHGCNDGSGIVLVEGTNAWVILLLIFRQAQKGIHNVFVMFQTVAPFKVPNAFIGPVMKVLFDFYNDIVIPTQVGCSVIDKINFFFPAFLYFFLSLKVGHGMEFDRARRCCV